jgi:AcrR family transcriptional regulator
MAESPPTGPPPSGKRARTRERLIEAAAEIIREKGWFQTSLEAVAVRAGMTRGAIYGNFRNREDLFLAVVQARWKPVIPQAAPGGTFREYMRTLGQAVAAAAPARRAQAAAALSFQLYALTHEEMRSRLSQLNAEIYRRGAERLQQSFPGGELPMPAHQLVRVLHGLTDGLTFLYSLTPELITKDVLIAAFEALAGAG